MNDSVIINFPPGMLQQCSWCLKPLPEKKSAAKIEISRQEMVGLPSTGGRKIETMNMEVPRCRGCYHYHKEVYKSQNRGVLIGLITGVMTAITGHMLLYILMRYKFIGDLNNWVFILWWLFAIILSTVIGNKKGKQRVLKKDDIKNPFNFIQTPIGVHITRELLKRGTPTDLPLFFVKDMYTFDEDITCYGESDLIKSIKNIKSKEFHDKLAVLNSKYESDEIPKSQYDYQTRDLITVYAGK